MSGSALDAFRDLLRDAARAVVEEAAPLLLEKLVPRVVAEVARVMEQQERAQSLDGYVGIKKAAKMIDAHAATVRKLMRENKLPRYSVESKPRLKVSDLHAYVGREGTASPTINFDERARQILSKKKKK